MINATLKNEEHQKPEINYNNKKSYITCKSKFPIGSKKLIILIKVFGKFTVLLSANPFKKQDYKVLGFFRINT